MKRRALLLDRDGVINVDHGYVGKRENFEFMPGLFPFLRAAQDMGFRFAVLTNQSGVARGLYTKDDFEKLTVWMQGEMVKEGIVLDLVLACFEHDRGTIPHYTRETFWRKPNPGMVLEAVQRMKLDAGRSAFLGDNLKDMQAAIAGGIGLPLFLSENSEKPESARIVRNFDEALEALRALTA